MCFFVCVSVCCVFVCLRVCTFVCFLFLLASYQKELCLHGGTLPLDLDRRTGTQTAMQLLRQSWKNHPLSQEESAQLRSIAAHAAQSPSLQLLVHELESSAQQLSFLYTDSSGEPGKGPQLNQDVATCYLREAELNRDNGWRGFEGNPRALLTQLEEQRVLGIRRKPLPQPAWLKQMRRTGKYQVHVPACPVPADFIAAAEQQLWSLVHTRPPSFDKPPPYPLSSSAAAGSKPLPLEMEMHRELEASWAAHHSLPVSDELDLLPEALHRHVAEMQVCRWAGLGIF